VPAGLEEAIAVAALMEDGFGQERHILLQRGERISFDGWK
jgi:hypothetical protein